MMNILHQITGGEPAEALLIIINLIVIESLLSVDNAAVLATMVMDLPKEQRGKALRYGILGAYLFRGICLALAVWLVKVWWLKPAGGVYLLYLATEFFAKKKDQPGKDPLAKEERGIYRKIVNSIGPFWSTVILVEFMDLAFSMDNVFAAVAFTNNIWLVCTGVFIGILAMRFVAQGFVKLMEKFPFLESSAFIVIFLLGLKLTFSLWTHFARFSPITIFLESRSADLYISAMTVTIFLFPVLTSSLFGWPGSKKK